MESDQRGSGRQNKGHANAVGGSFLACGGGGGGGKRKMFNT